MCRCGPIDMLVLLSAIFSDVGISQTTLLLLCRRSLGKWASPPPPLYEGLHIGGPRDCFNTGGLTSKVLAVASLHTIHKLSLVLLHEQRVLCCRHPSKPVTLAVNKCENLRVADVQVPSGPLSVLPKSCILCNPPFLCHQHSSMTPPPPLRLSCNISESHLNVIFASCSCISKTRSSRHPQWTCGPPPPFPRLQPFILVPPLVSFCTGSSVLGGWDGPPPPRRSVAQGTYQMAGGQALPPPFPRPSTQPG